MDTDKDEYLNWLNSLEVGDKVYYETRTSIGIYEIERLTRTLIILNNGVRVRRKDGSVQSDNCFYYVYILKPTVEHRKKIKFLKLRRSVNSLVKKDFSKLTFDQLVKVENVLKDVFHL